MEFVYWKTGLIGSLDNPNPTEFEKRPSYHGLFRKSQQGNDDMLPVEENIRVSSEDKQEFIEECIKVFKEILDKSK